MWVKEKLLVTSNFSFSHSVFKRHVSQGRQKVSLCGNGLNPNYNQPKVGDTDSHYNRIDSTLTAVHCYHNGYVGKQPVPWKEYCGEYWSKELQEQMDRCTGRDDITEIMLKTALNTIQ